MSYKDLECPKCGTLARITHREGTQVQCCNTKGCEGNWPWRTVGQWSIFKAEIDHMIHIIDSIDTDTTITVIGDDNVFDEILNAAREMDKKQQMLAYFVVGSWGFNVIRHKGAVEMGKSINTLIGQPLHVYKCMPRDELWGMSSDNDILFKIKVEQ